jgi:hypothetical protein
VDFCQLIEAWKEEGGAEEEEQLHFLSYIYLGSSVCHIPVCHPVTIAERSAILLVLVIKLTKEMRPRV